MTKHNTAEIKREVVRLKEELNLPYSEISKRLGGIPIGTLKSFYRESLLKTGQEANPKEGTNTFEQGRDFINVVCASRRVLKQEDLIAQFNIDMSEWEIISYKVKTSEGYRKDRKVEWKVENGQVVYGDVHDTGKMLVVPLYHIELRLRKKQRESRAKDAVEDLLNDAKKHAPKYPPVAYKKIKSGHLFEIAMPDIHFGRLAWEEETGEDFDIKIARECVDSVVDQLLAFASQYEISKILLPIGNDYFNSDNSIDTTAHGTPQQEDTRWAKTFRKGREMAVSIIDRCASIAPVDVLVVPGNHDLQRSFYLGEALSAWYHNNKSVSIDNSARARKYYLFGKNLIGFAHGYSEKLNNLPIMMAIEEPKLWAESSYREWHTGDKHHKQDMVTRANEDNGVVVRILRSLVPADAWTFGKGFNSLRAAEAFMWNKDNGLVAQFTASPTIKQSKECV